MNTRLSRTSSIRLIAFDITNHLPDQQISSIIKDYYIEISINRESLSLQRVKARVIKARMIKARIIRARIIKAKIINV
jgi:hypothetical protein